MQDARKREWRFRLVLLAFAGAVFAGLAAYLRAVERSVIAAGVSDQVDAGRLRPAAEVARLAAALKLVTVEVETTATAERTSESWRGDVKATVAAPTRLLFGTDLSGLDVTRVVLSPLTGAYLVRVPPPSRIATEVDGGQEETRVEVGWGRTRSIAGEYWLGQARKGLYDEARRLAISPEDAVRVRATTRRQVAALMQKIVGQPQVRVVFEDE
ncbi:MAG: DUF4230 domain-containing protein [Phycisphaerales bacterium]|nr:DUF4230 domain-containing protein [Phycisphaerales bacterium]